MAAAKSSKLEKIRGLIFTGKGFSKMIEATQSLRKTCTVRCAGVQSDKSRNESDQIAFPKEVLKPAKKGRRNGLLKRIKKGSTCRRLKKSPSLCRCGGSAGVVEEKKVEDRNYQD